MIQKHACGFVGWQSAVGVVLACSAAAAVVATCLAAEPAAQPGNDDKETRELSDKILHPWAPSKADGKKLVKQRPDKLTTEQIDRVAQYLRQKYPYRSLRDRLAYEQKLPKDRPAPKLSKAVTE